MWYYVLSAVLFVLSQLDYFLLNKVICKVRGRGRVHGFPLRLLMDGVQGANAKVDGSFVATILETAAVGVLYLAWRSITEGTSLLFPYNSDADAITESWDDDHYLT